MDCPTARTVPIFVVGRCPPNDKLGADAAILDRYQPPHCLSDPFRVKKRGAENIATHRASSPGKAGIALKTQDSLLDFILKEWLLIASGAGLVLTSIYTSHIPAYSLQELQVLFILFVLFVAVNGLQTLCQP